MFPGSKEKATPRVAHKDSSPAKTDKVLCRGYIGIMEKKNGNYYLEFRV